MDRREFLKDSALLTAAGVVLPQSLEAKAKKVVADDIAADAKEAKDTKLITSAPMLQNYAADSIGIAFAVSAMANGFVDISENADMSDARRVKCGGYRVTAMNDQVMQIRVTGLKPATRYYYTIGADRILYEHGYHMEILGTETDPRIYSFTTAGKDAVAHFCVINDTHEQWPTMQALTDKIADLAPSCVVWNGDASNTTESVDIAKQMFLAPPISRRDYASETPFLFCPGNHDNRGLYNRHLENVWMFRQPEERLSRDWDLGRNFAVRMGDIAMIGLDTAEDKLDSNPLFAGLFNSKEYREAQTVWLAEALKRREIASAPFLVAFCHIPLFDSDPTHNPGDVAPADTDPRYTSDYAFWQRTCSKMWGPLLHKAKCQLLICAHMHMYRYDEPTRDRCWGQIVGGGKRLDSSVGFPTIIEGQVADRTLHITVHNMNTGVIQQQLTFKAR